MIQKKISEDEFYKTSFLSFELIGLIYNVLSNDQKERLISLLSEKIDFFESNPTIIETMKEDARKYVIVELRRFRDEFSKHVRQ